MGAFKPDYVVEAVHLDPFGRLELARLYERRGASYSDRVVVPRKDLIRLLAAGKSVSAGTRQPYLASTFSLLGELHLSGSKDASLIRLGDEPAEQDHFPGIPVF